MKASKTKLNILSSLVGLFLTAGVVYLSASSMEVLADPETVAVVTTTEDPAVFADPVADTATSTVEPVEDIATSVSPAEEDDTPALIAKKPTSAPVVTLTPVPKPTPTPV